MRARHNGACLPSNRDRGTREDRRHSLHRPSAAARGYGPWEQVASTLTEGFVARGHEVTLFASSDSVTSARLHATAAAGYEEDPRLDAKVWERCTTPPPLSAPTSST